MARRTDHVRVFYLKGAIKGFWPLGAELRAAFVQVSGGCGIRTHEDASTP